MLLPRERALTLLSEGKIPSGLFCGLATEGLALVLGALTDGGSVVQWWRKKQTKTEEEEAAAAKTALSLALSPAFVKRPLRTVVLPFFSRNERSPGWSLKV